MYEPTDNIALHWPHCDIFMKHYTKFCKKHGIDGEHLSPNYPAIFLSTDGVIFSLVLETFDWCNAPIREEHNWGVNRGKSSN